ncbi:MAG TPA: hypothetical protein VJP89_13910 [Pyrinomonadaceae bacterium]|nr:hypothetical protein [Pyrinomonadaceae bacterium]
MTEQDFKQETKIRQYLLGQLTLEEQVLVEQRLFLESEYAELAEAVEGDLIDEYLHDDLTGGERKKFEDHFLGQPEHRVDLKIAQALDKYLTSDIGVEPRKETILTSIRQIPSLLVSLVTQRPVISFALATPLLILISLITWNAVKSTRPNPGEPVLQAQDQQPANTPPANEPSPAVLVNGNKEDVNTNERQGRGGSDEGPVEKNTRNQADKQQRPSAAFATFQILPGGLSRSGGRPNSVRISSNIERVVLILPLDMPEHYDRYRYELLSNGRVVNKGELKSVTDTAEPAVSITLPVKLLTRESYEIKIRGIAADGRSSAPSSYFFIVERPRQ